MNIELVAAHERDAEEINRLVNLSYRGEKGWTRETDIVSGERSTLEEIYEYLANPNAYLFIAKSGNQIVSCICVEKKGEDGYIGYFAVHPSCQGKGVGKVVLSKAEAFAKQTLGVSKYVMVVVSQRSELIQYYERRGYRRTGKVLDYPIHLNVGIPKSGDLTLEYLEKNVQF